MKRAIFIIVTITLLSTVGVAQEAEEDPPVLTENMVVFLGPSGEEFDEIVAKDPDSRDELIEWLADYYFYRKTDVEPRLTKLGIGIKIQYKTWKEMKYRDANGQEKILVREDIAGIVMYPKGKPPVIAYPEPGRNSTKREGVIYFWPGPDSMIEAISKYFGIKIE